MNVYMIMTKGMHYTFAYLVAAESQAAAAEVVEKQLCEHERIEDCSTAIVSTTDYGQGIIDMNSVENLESE